jgi:hypothetical protein
MAEFHSEYHSIEVSPRLEYLIREREAPSTLESIKTCDIAIGNRVGVD